MSKRLGLGLPCYCQCPVSRQHPNWIVLVVANFIALKKEHVKQCWTTSFFQASFISSSMWNFGDAKSSFRGSQHYHIPQNGWLMHAIMAAFGWWPRWFRDNSILVAMLYIMGKPQPDSTSAIGCLRLSSTRLAYWYVCSEQLITVLYLL